MPDPTRSVSTVGPSPGLDEEDPGTPCDDVDVECPPVEGVDDTDDVDEVGFVDLFVEVVDVVCEDVGVVGSVVGVVGGGVGSVD